MPRKWSNEYLGITCHYRPHAWRWLGLLIIAAAWLILAVGPGMIERYF